MNRKNATKVIDEIIFNIYVIIEDFVNKLEETSFTFSHLISLLIKFREFNK